MEKRDIAREFDRKASTYETSRLGSWYTAQLEQLVQHMDATADAALLDIGCGTGWLLRSLATARPDRQFMGIDLSPKMIEVARDKLPAGISNVEFIASDWESLDLARLSSHPIGEIVCTSALHYFQNPCEALSKMRDLLARNGSLYLVERDKSASPITMLWDLLHRHYIQDHVRFYTRRQLHDMLIDAGFSGIDVLDNINRYFWHGKLQTHVVLLRARKT